MKRPTIPRIKTTRTGYLFRTRNIPISAGKAPVLMELPPRTKFIPVGTFRMLRQRFVHGGAAEQNRILVELGALRRRGVKWVDLGEKAPDREHKGKPRMKKTLVSIRAAENALNHAAGLI